MLRRQASIGLLGELLGIPLSVVVDLLRLGEPALLINWPESAGVKARVCRS